MARIALFHSVYGVRPGVRDAAERLRAAGHEVEIVDQYEGRVFDDFDEASAFAEAIGFPALMQRALAGVEHLSDGFIAGGFSNGGGMAEFVACSRIVSGVLMLSGALPVALLGAEGWPASVPAQIHYTVGDPRRRQEWIDDVVTEIHAAGATVECFDYPGNGHLLTDASLADEYDPDASALVWERVLDACERWTGAA